MNHLRLIRLTGVCLILLIVFLNIPYIQLIRSFEYDDILRNSVGYILTHFYQGGFGLIMTWLAFAFSALLFIPVSILLHNIFQITKTPYLAIATSMGVLSGILQSIGLLRWVFVIPILANQYVQASNNVEKNIIEIVYRVVNQYGGVLIGEYLGQVMLIGWTFGICIAILRSDLVHSWIGWYGICILPLLIIGHSELFATVIPHITVIETTPIGFILWQVWLLILGIALLLVPTNSNPQLSCNCILDK